MADTTSDSVCPTLRDEERLQLQDEKTRDDAASIPSQAPDEEDQIIEEPPDGGLQAWLQVLTGHLVAFNSWGYFISFGIFQPYYESQFSMPASTISWIGSLEVCLIFFIGTFSGRAFDAGHFRTALAVGLFLQILGIFMTSIASAYWQVLLAQGLCQDVSPLLAPALLQRAQSLTTEHDTLQKNLNSSFDSNTAKRVGELSRVAEALKAWEKSQLSVKELTHMLDDSSLDEDLAAIARDELDTERGQLESLARKLSASLTPRHPFADFPCMLEFRPGPGGLEGRYFMDTLFKMYKALCMRRGYRHTVVKYEFADGAGDSSSSAGENPLQEAILEVHDQGAFDIFRSEAGMHRVQRIPSTETKGRVHTSAVAVWVLPSFPENGATSIDFDDPESDFYVNPQEVKIETMRARGAGGQHVNKTESAIRMTHLPTGTTVSMQDHRSQQRNREEAWKLLRSRIADQRREQREEEASQLRNSVLSKTQITRGDKIRTYNYNQDRCTDHRAGIDVHDLPNVLEGGEKLDRIMDGAKDWLVGKDIELLVAEEEVKEKDKAKGTK
ncbi:Peptide chain release factor 1, mitochondrial [Fusarium chlamydosporum]